MNLGEAIKKQRKLIGLSQGELADACNITQSYLSMIEKNKKEPNLATIKELSEKLNLPVPALFIKAIDLSDVPENKREIYNAMSDTLDSLINSIFIEK